MPYYPDDLVNELKGIWPKVQIPGESNLPSLPTDTLLQSLLDTCYHASFLTEEGRNIAFRVAFLAKPNRRLEERDTHWTARRAPLPLNEPRQLSATELMRLAPATDPTQVIICVEPDKSGSRLLIWGLMDCSSSWWEWLTQKRDGAYPPPNCLTITATAPGTLSVSRMGRHLITLAQGNLRRLAVETLNAPELGEVFDDAINALVDIGATELKEYGDEFRSDNEYVKSWYLRLWKRLVATVESKGHGGTILVIPESSLSSEGELDRAVRLKYAGEYAGTWELLSKSITARWMYLAKCAPFLNVGRDTEGKEVTPVWVDNLWEHMRSTSNAVTDASNFLASLTQVDGALLLTDRFRVLGFGGEIVVPDPGITEVSVVVDQETMVMEQRKVDGFGTRHRSAFRFCYSTKSSAAFIISSDGGVKIVKRCGSDLVMWPELGMGPYGL